MLAQIGGSGDITSLIIWFVFPLLLFMMLPRMMSAQTVLKLEKETRELDAMAISSREKIARAVTKRPAAIRDRMRDFMDFFMVSPIGADPYGIVRKIDLVVRQSDKRFRWFVNQLAPRLNADESANVRNALEGAMMVHQIAKVVRHYLELVRKYKMYQIGMIIQMQLPLIHRMAKAAEAATDAFLEGTPIGDGIGPLIVARLMQNKPHVFVDEEFAVAKARIANRNVLIAKASGPGASTGYPGKFLLKLTKDEKINRIITIDAGLRLEGEKTGSVCEGVGVAMGGSGVDRYEIEEFAVSHNIPLDAVVVKVNEEEALSAMTKEVLAAVSKATSTMEEAVKRSDRKDKILIMGVGNTCGIGNSKASVKEAEDKIKKAALKVKPEKKKSIFPW